jgi:LacI family gluconate utilization system Gnt-I transcriptional repressor
MRSMRGRTAGQTRMEDVARRVGVSIVTVSRTLHRPEKVSEKTRRRVLRAIAATGYVENLVAGSLASNRTNVIAAIVPTLSNPAYGMSVHAISEVLRKNGLHLLLGTSGFSTTEEESLIATFLGRRPDGLFLHGCRHTPQARRLLRNAGVPVVETGDLVKRPLDMVVSYSNFDAAKAMTAHLLAKGYRRIGFVSAPVAENDRHLHRWRGYRAALHQHGVLYHPAYFLERPFGLHYGAEALLTTLDRHPDVEAIFFASDVFAVGALLECLRQAWPVPQKVAIAGFGDQEIAREVVPSLSTVRIPREEIGRLAGQMLLDRLQGQAVKRKIVDVGFEIIDRASA